LGVTHRPLIKNGSFDVFLSHNSKDKPTARQLANALQVRGLRVWLDEEQLMPGRHWQEALEEIIQTARTAVVLVGQDGLGPWEIPEIRACLSQFVKRGLPVIPVLLTDAPSTPELPLFLQGYIWVDLRGGLTDEGLKRLEWGITGVKPGQSPGSAEDRLRPSELRILRNGFRQPDWASALGVDGYGLYADFGIEGVTQRMRWIAPGAFQMGSPEDEPERGDDERRHEVVLTRGFWLAETACTQALWEAVMGENPSRFKGAERPVESVSWEDASNSRSQDKLLILNNLMSELFVTKNVC
jgi:hypothetical protein